MTISYHPNREIRQLSSSKSFPCRKQLLPRILKCRTYQHVNSVRTLALLPLPEFINLIRTAPMRLTPLLLWSRRLLSPLFPLLVSGQVSAQNPTPRDLPTSPRARAAADNVRGSLARDLTDMGLRYGNPVFIRILKEEAELELFVQEAGRKTFKLFRTYKIAAMSGHLGPKEREGDLQAPEGFYYVPPHRMNPNSRFHLSFNLGYPNTYDRLHGRDGSHLMVHGNRVSVGCFAMTDPKIEEIYTLCHAALANGQRFFRVHSFPFRMTGERMEQARSDRWHSFWKNLRQGYDFFQQHRFPPDVQVTGKHYIFK